MRPLTALGWAMYALSAAVSVGVLASMLWFLGQSAQSWPLWLLITTSLFVAFSAWIGIRIGNHLKKQQQDYLTAAAARRRPPSED